MIAYRAICHTGDIKLPSLGIHFSLSPQMAYPYGATRVLGKNVPDNYYLYICHIRACDINVRETAAKNESWPSEKEILVNPGAEIEVIQVIELSMKYQQIKQIHFLTFKTIA